MLKLFSKGQFFGFLGGLLGTVLFGFIIWIIFLGPSEIFEIKNSSAGLLQKNLTEKDLNIKTETEIKIEAEPEPEEAPEVLIESFQDKIDNIEEKIDIVEQEISQLLVQETVKNQEEVLAETVEIEEIEEIEEAKEPADDFIKLLISEVQVAGLADEKQEFIEIFNPNDFDVDLTGWSVKRKTATAENWSAYANSQLLEGRKIFAKGFFVIARTGYFTGASNVFTDTPITADNSFAIENSAGEIVDKLGFGGAVDPELLPAQNPEDGQSIGRKFLDSATIQDTDNNLADFEAGFITPFFQNADNVYYSIGGAGEAGYCEGYAKIFISEVQVYPIEERFVELFNPNDCKINLTDWYLQRKTTEASDYSSFVTKNNFAGKKIEAGGYFLISRQLENSDILSDISLNDDDYLVLKNQDGQIVDQVNWQNSPAENYSYGRKFGENALDYFEIDIPTPKAQNIKYIEEDAEDLIEEESEIPEEDTTPPTGILLINGGAEYTNSREVILTISATDDASEVVEMNIANYTHYYGWEPYLTTKNWTLSDGEGTKTVRIKFKDSSENETKTGISATIIFSSSYENDSGDYF